MACGKFLARQLRARRTVPLQDLGFVSPTLYRWRAAREGMPAAGYVKGPRPANTDCEHNKPKRIEDVDSTGPDYAADACRSGLLAQT